MKLLEVTIMSFNFLDTSAILNGALNSYSYNTYISTISLMELENIKTSFSKDEKVKYKARSAVRELIDMNGILFPSFNKKLISRVLKKYNFLS